MRILILGAGTVGFSIGRLLSSNQHDVTLVDQDPARLAMLSESLDAMVLEGNITHASVLRQAEVGKADLCLAVTDSDSANLVAASMAKQMGARRTVARVYSRMIQNLEIFNYCDHFKIDKVLSLEYLTAVRLAQAIDNFTESLNLESYLYGSLEFMEFGMESGARGMGRRIRDLKFPDNVRIGAIRRNEIPFIPRADDALKQGDKIAIFGVHEDLLQVCKSLGGELPQKKNIVIAGGGETGMHLAQLLKTRHRIRLLETDRERAEMLAETLGRSVEVINLDLRNRADMEEEHIGMADVFVACTGLDEYNLIGCVEAKEMGAKRTYSVINRVDYGDVIKAKLGIDSWISPLEAAARRVRNFLQCGVVISSDSIFNSQIQLMEIEVQAGSPISQAPIKDAKLPPQCIVLGASRKNGQKNQVPGANFRFDPGDIALIVTRDEHQEKVVSRFEAES